MTIATSTGRSGSDGLLWDVVQRHLDEAEFQAEAFERALNSCVHSLDSLRKGPERWLLAHIDGLVVNGPPVVERLLLPIIQAPDPKEGPLIAAACMAAIALGGVDLFAPLLLHPEHSVRRIAARAGGLCANLAVDNWVLEQLTNVREPNHLAGLLEYSAARRLQPQAPLFAWLQDKDPTIALSAIAAAAASDPLAHAVQFDKLVDGHADAMVREAAIIPALTTGSVRAWTACERAALEVGANQAMVSVFAAMGGPVHHARIAARLVGSALTPSAIVALGFSGNVSHVPGMIEKLAHPEAAIRKAAFQSISLIAGLDLTDDSLQITPSSAAASSLPLLEDDAEALAALPELSDDDLDGALVPEPEEALPEPMASAIEAWWSRNRRRFDPQTRYLLGQPFNIRSALACLEGDTGLRLRHTVAISLTIRSRGQLSFDTRALSRVQRAQLASRPPIASRLTGPVPGW
jgi:uncharacterized protein (TIGR02270 family)